MSIPINCGFTRPRTSCITGSVSFVPSPSSYFESYTFISSLPCEPAPSSFLLAEFESPHDTSNEDLSHFHEIFPSYDTLSDDEDQEWFHVNVGKCLPVNSPSSMDSANQEDRSFDKQADLAHLSTDGTVDISPCNYRTRTASTPGLTPLPLRSFEFTRSRPKSMPTKLPSQSTFDKTVDQEPGRVARRSTPIDIPSKRTPPCSSNSIIPLPPSDVSMRYVSSSCRSLYSMSSSVSTPASSSSPGHRFISEPLDEDENLSVGSWFDDHESIVGVMDDVDEDHHLCGFGQL